MPRLSIIIPCLGGAAEFDGTLVSVLQNRPAGCEVMVVHTEPYGDPYGLSQEVRFIRVPGESLVQLANSAIEFASGEILHFVGCGLEVAEGWTEPAVSHFADSEIAAVSPVVLDGEGKKLLAAGVRYSLGGARHVATESRLLSPGAGRLRAKILGPTLTAAFYRRDVLAALDGFDSDIGDSLADVEMALAIQSLGRLHICEPASRLIQIAGPGGVLAQPGFAHGRAAEQIFWRYAARRGMAASLAMHVFTVAADIIRQATSVTSITSLCGRGFSMLEIGAVQRADQRMNVASERLAELATLRATIKMPAKRAAKEAAVANVSRRKAA